MRYAIFGDIHANLEAFQTVLEDARTQGATDFVCLGDMVGYNADPIACLELVRDLQCPVVKGNHDEQASENTELTYFNPLAARAIQWTRDQLSSSHKDWLRALKFSRLVRNFTIVHATLDSPSSWGYTACGTYPPSQKG
jgi:predicted phosphodiesterase